MGEKEKNNIVFRDNTNLEYKNHDDFFNRFYQTRWDLINSIVQVSETINNKIDLKQLEYTIDSLEALILWSYSQLRRGGADLNKIKDMKKEIIKLIGQKKYKTAIEEIKVLFEYISEIHEKTELIPRISVQEKENERFWREEKNKAMKEVKKAFYDVLMVE